MSTLSTIILTCFILFLCHQMTDGLACYSCTNCNDPFNSNYIQVLYQNDTVPYFCSKTSTAYVISRGMSPTCSSYGNLGNGQWCCQTNLCNGVKRNMLTKSFILVISILMFVIFF